MKQKKLQEFIEHQYPGFHTLSGVVLDLIDLNLTTNHPMIKVSTHIKVKNEDRKVTYLQLNPNKYVGNQMITSYSMYMKVLESIFTDIGSSLDRFSVRRADMSFNNDIEGSYESYRKLHRLLICCLANQYNVVNCYQSQDLWTYKSLNIAIKNNYLEAENYDKEQESHGSVPIKNRLELRSKCIQDESSLRHEFVDKWCNRLDTVVGNYEAVQKRYNNELEHLYKEDLVKPKKDRDYLNLTAFLLQYKECIFCTSQMVDLLSRFDEVKDPVKKARSFKVHHTIEYFSRSNLQVIVDSLKKCITEYFTS